MRTDGQEVVGAAAVAEGVGMAAVEEAGMVVVEEAGMVVVEVDGMAAAVDGVVVAVVVDGHASKGTDMESKCKLAHVKVISGT